MEIAYIVGIAVGVSVVVAVTVWLLFLYVFNTHDIVSATISIPSVAPIEGSKVRTVPYTLTDFSSLTFAHVTSDFAKYAALPINEPDTTGIDATLLDLWIAGSRFIARVSDGVRGGIRFYLGTSSTTSMDVVAYTKDAVVVLDPVEMGQPATFVVAGYTDSHTVSVKFEVAA